MDFQVLCTVTGWRLGYAAPPPDFRADVEDPSSLPLCAPTTASMRQFPLFVMVTMTYR